MDPIKFHPNQYFGIYIHYPFCVHKCSYCDFYSLGEGKNQSKDELQYHELIIKEIDLWIEKFISINQTKVTSIFFGGGTPSRMSLDSLGLILEKIRSSFELKQNLEVTIESNPEDLNLQKIDSWQKLGINRISIGVQSLKKKHLETLDRYVDDSKYNEILYIIENSQIKNINADLIYGIPGQTKLEFFEDIQSLVNAGVQHLSLYSLTREKGTKYYRDSENDPSKSPNEDLQEIIFKELPFYMNNLGFNWYEVSNYSKPDKECQHNLCYWMMNSYLGLGAGAHGMIENKRFYHPKNFIHYKKHILENNLNCEMEKVDYFPEFLLNAFRLLKHMNLNSLFQNLNEIEIEKFKKILEIWKQKKLCIWDGSNFQWNEQGILILDSLISECFSSVKAD